MNDRHDPFTCHFSEVGNSVSPYGKLKHDRPLDLEGGSLSASLKGEDTKTKIAVYLGIGTIFFSLFLMTASSL